MELQWPLILFTTLVAWSCGLFASQGILVLKGADTCSGGKRAQTVALVVSVVLLAAGGIAVFFHLQHWERIFNGFGHLTSGITQELIAIVVMAAVMVAYFVCLRKPESATKPVAILAVASAVLLTCVMAHSYMMPARPAWDSVLWVVCVLGNACVLGPATMAVIAAACGGDAKESASLTLWGAVINAVASAAFAAWMQLSGSAFTDVGFHYDPTHPTHGMLDVTGTVNIVSGDSAALFWVGVVVIGLAASVVCAALAKRASASKAATWCACTCVAAVIGAVCMRVVFYNVGLSLFTFF